MNANATTDRRQLEPHEARRVRALLDCLDPTTEHECTVQGCIHSEIRAPAAGCALRAA